MRLAPTQVQRTRAQRHLMGTEGHLQRAALHAVLSVNTEGSPGLEITTVEASSPNEQHHLTIAHNGRLMSETTEGQALDGAQQASGSQRVGAFLGGHSKG